MMMISLDIPSKAVEFSNETLGCLYGSVHYYNEVIGWFEKSIEYYIRTNWVLCTKTM